MNEFDDFDDPQLRSTLQRAAGPAPDLHVALAAVSSRAKRIQRRRTVSVAATSLGLVVAAVAIVARPLDHDVKVTPGTDVNHVSTTVPVTTSPTTPAPRPSAPPATPAVTNPIATRAPGTSVDDHGAASGRSGTSAGSNAAGNETQTYSSEGGSVTVRLQNGAVRIVAGPSAASGFQASVIDRGPDRVRVEFDTSGRRSRITVTAAGGHLVGQVSESGHGGGQGGGGSVRRRLVWRRLRLAAARPAAAHLAAARPAAARPAAARPAAEGRVAVGTARAGVVPAGVAQVAATTRAAMVGTAEEESSSQPNPSPLSDVSPLDNPAHPGRNPS